MKHSSSLTYDLYTMRHRKLRIDIWQWSFCSQSLSSGLFLSLISSTSIHHVEFSKSLYVLFWRKHVIEIKINKSQHNANQKEFLFSYRDCWPWVFFSSSIEGTQSGCLNAMDLYVLIVMGKIDLDATFSNQMKPYDVFVAMLVWFQLNAFLIWNRKIWRMPILMNQRIVTESIK